MLKHTLALVAVGFMCSVAVGEARVTRIEVLKVEPVPAAQTNGEAVPPYERISGRFYGELDPRDPKNALITDIQFAPKNARGMVEYVGTFSLMKPADMSRASGVLMYSVVNRGNGSASAKRRGSRVARERLAGGRHSVGHQSDDSGAARKESRRQQYHRTVRDPDHRPDRKHGDLDDSPGDSDAVSAGDARHRAATLVSAVSETPMGVKSGVVKIASTDWAFATCEKTPFPGVSRSDAYLPEERIQSVAALRAAVHGERSARPWHRLRGHARSQFVLPL